LQIVLQGLASLLAFADALFLELTLFAAVGFAIGGIDELAVDLLWIAARFSPGRRRARRNMIIPVAPCEARLRYAVMVPAWNESAVIGRMIDTSLAAYRNSNVVLFIGCYPNDPETIAQVARRTGERVRLVIGPRGGPTTKADCLNAIWAAIAAERCNGTHFDAVILHDAEDRADHLETCVFDMLIAHHGAIQLPVIPAALAHSRWISGHYCDEFAEAHGKTMVVRDAIGAGLPLAGVGCAIRVDLLDALAAGADGRPFDDGSLTEDYELGLRLSEGGNRPVFVRARDSETGALIATRADFPTTLEKAVRQKARWATGIGLAGWDRLGWAQGWVDNWMRLRDRRGLLSAIILFAGYCAFLLGAMLVVAHLVTAQPMPIFSSVTANLLLLNSVLLIWRLFVRACFVSRLHGAAEALRSMPRTVLGNVVAMLSARRACFGYAKMLRTGEISWDKTEHSFSGAPIR
jgi:bacteriophage N4 adsorption protein B